MSFLSSAMMMGFALPAFSVSLSATTAGGSSSSSTVTSGAVTANRLGGSGQSTALWTRFDGSTAIVPVAPNSPTTTWQATGMSVGSISARFLCTLTDKITGEVQATGLVTVTLDRGNPPLDVSGPADAINTQASSGSITVSASTGISYSGGVGPFVVTVTYSGDFSMSGSGTSRTFSRLLAPQGGVQGTATFTVKDQGTGESVSRSCTVMLINNGTAPSPLSVWVDDDSVEGFGSTGSASAGPVTASWSGGVGPFVVSWSKVSGSGSVSAGGASASFAASGIPVQGTLDGTFQVTVLDQGTGIPRSATVFVVFYNFGLG